MSAQNDSGYLRAFLLAGAAVAALGALIYVIADLVGGDGEASSGDSRRQAAIAERIAPVGEVAVVSADAAPAAPRPGDQVVTEVCASCHASGALGAPKIGDGAAWRSRLEAGGGLDGLVKSAIAGKGAMPPRGGGEVSDEELRAAIAHMLEKSGVEAGGSAAASAAQTAGEAVGEAVRAVGEAVSEAAAAVGEQVAEVMPGAAAPAAAVEDASGLALSKGCLSCHQVDSRVLGPSYREVAKKYRGDATAEGRLVQHVRQGTVGNWGQIPMPPNNVTEDEAARLVRWILSL